MRTSRTAAVLLASIGLVAVSACSSSKNTNAGSSSSSSAPAAASSAASSAASAPASSAASSPAAAAPCVSGSLSGAGSSFQAPMQQKWIADYLTKCSGAKVNYTSVGSGAGIQQFGAGTIDFAGSDVTMQPSEQSTADSRCGGSPAVHLPVSAGGVGITWNLPNVTALQFSPDTLADIFQAKVTKWNDPEIAADNPGVTLPSTSITVFHRSDASGTNSVFSSFMAAASKKWTLGTGKTLNWPGSSQGAKGNEGVSAGVSQTTGGITYTEQAFALQHNLPLAKIKNGGGTFVELTADNVSKALESATIKPASANDLSATMNYQPTDANAYPISTLTYVIVCSKYPSSMSADKVNLLKNFLNYAVTGGQQFAKDLGYSPLPASLVTKDQASINAIS